MGATSIGHPFGTDLRKLGERIRAWRSARALLQGVIVYVCLAPLLSVLAQALLLGAAASLSTIAELAHRHFLPRVAVDPVYGGAIFSLIGHIDTRGLAIAGPIGAALHQLAPDLFAPSALVSPGASASAVIETGATIPARAAARIAATPPLLVAAIFVATRSSTPRWARVAAGLTQLHLLIDQAPDLALTPAHIEAAGLPFLVAALLPADVHGQRPFFTTTLHALPADQVAWGSAVMLSLVTMAAAWGLAHVDRILHLHTAAPKHRFTPPWPHPQRNAVRWTTIQLARMVALVLGITVSPLGALSDSEPHFVDDEPMMARSPATSPPGQSVIRSSAERSRVSVSGRDYRFTYQVNGQPTVIRGVGYNPWYAALDLETRQSLYNRDFERMRDMGANTIEGWFQDQFDEVCLDAAQRHDLGVIMPFELNQDYDYGDPAVRATFLASVTDWVQRYKNHPAVRIWAPGNEVMHRLIYPTIVRSAPPKEGRVASFAEFYVELIDAIHALDPDHPVLYRDAEDGYLKHLRAALQRDGRPRPWFIYGANTYTPRIEQMIRDWPNQGLDLPLVISEFAPTGVSREDRPRRFEWFWSVIRSRPDVVLGGVAYTWSTNGPEDLDRVFGLTDQDGKPIDESVAVLGRLFRQS